MTIGERIKNLRKKNDLTQEELAVQLGVSYQAVSKWECGIACPDLSLIGPLTKLFCVSADELLGLDGESEDVRRSEFDTACHEYWKNEDHEENFHMAQEAVREYPDDFRYLEWLATSEYDLAFDADRETASTLENCHEFFWEMMDNSMRHYEYIIDNCDDTKIRNMAIIGMIFDLVFLYRMDEARWYAETVYPEKGLWEMLEKMDFTPIHDRESFAKKQKN